MGTIEEKILKILLEVYPITVEEIARDLKLSETASRREMSRLESKSYILLEPLGDKTYIRLLRMDFRFIGTKASQRRRLKHKSGKKGGGQKRTSSEPVDNHMYG